jgi:hypothetical protein
VERVIGIGEKYGLICFKEVKIYGKLVFEARVYIPPPLAGGDVDLPDRENMGSPDQ